jgi:2-polyprenyl-3-methyl-5-hydroxy-6-metoxy-1,4-benzoquinol methylase
MAENTSESDAVERHRLYPDLEQDYAGQDFQRRRIRGFARLVHEGERVLDVGCNSGYIVDYVPRSCEVHGVDVQPDLIEKAKARLVSAQVAQAEALPFPNKSFDTVILSEVLEHVFDPVQVVREAARVARLRFIGSTPHENGAWGKHTVSSHTFHVRCFTREELENLLWPYGALMIGTTDCGGSPQTYWFEVVL